MRIAGQCSGSRLCQHRQQAAGGGQGDLSVDIIKVFQERRLITATVHEFHITAVGKVSTAIRHDLLGDGVVFRFLGLRGIRRSD